MWKLDCEESWAPKNWCFWTVVLEKTLESPLDCKDIQPVHSKGDQSWVFFGRNDTKGETPTLWPPHVKSWLIGKDSDAGRDWGQEEKGMTEDEMAGRRHWPDGCEFEWTPGVGDGQGGLACCDSWGHKESDTTEQLNWMLLKWFTFLCHVRDWWKYSWPNMDLNWVVLLLCGYFSINTYCFVTVYSCLNSWIQSQGYRGLTIKFYMNFLLCTTNPSVIQRSTVL